MLDKIPEVKYNENTEQIKHSKERLLYMKEIKIVFKDTSNENPWKEGCYDLYIDGVKQERVKRFAIDLPMIPYDPNNSKNINLDLYSYTLEKFCDIWKD